jgi:hypothetical protein
LGETDVTTVVLPAEAITYLHILRVASNWMFGLFLLGACLSFVLIFIMPLSVYSRWVTIFLIIFAGLNALSITIASVVGTAISVIFQHALVSYQELNIGAIIGKKMLAFVWIADAFSIFAWIIQICLFCRCNSRRDVTKERRRWRWKSATEGTTSQPQVQERSRRVLFWRRT